MWVNKKKQGAHNGLLSRQNQIATSGMSLIFTEVLTKLFFIKIYTQKFWANFFFHLTNNCFKG